MRSHQAFRTIAVRLSPCFLLIRIMTLSPRVPAPVRPRFFVWGIRPASRSVADFRIYEVRKPPPPLAFREICKRCSWGDYVRRLQLCQATISGSPASSTAPLADAYLPLSPPRAVHARQPKPAAPSAPGIRSISLVASSKLEAAHRTARSRGLNANIVCRALYQF